MYEIKRVNGKSCTYSNQSNIINNYIISVHAYLKQSIVLVRIKLLSHGILLD